MHLLYFHVAVTLGTKSLGYIKHPILVPTLEALSRSDSLGLEPITLRGHHVTAETEDTFRVR